MKKIIKINGVATNAFGKTAEIREQRLRNPRNSVFAFVTMQVNGRFVTSENSIALPHYIEKGSPVAVWCVKGREKRILRTPIGALLCLYNWD